MPRQTEPNVNNALGVLLQGMLSSSQVRSENTQAIAVVQADIVRRPDPRGDVRGAGAAM